MMYFRTDFQQNSAFPMGMSEHLKNALGERFGREQAKPKEGPTRRSLAGEWNGCLM